ncbi:TPA: AAA family ATPase [Vibrio vulnificus]|nr:AAA family ATPase [Vibrio vulnificus]
MSFEFSSAEIMSVCTELGLPEDAYSEKESERRKILDYWEDCNIVACPGSGKSTVLLTKLILLSKRMPLKDGAGICVLTHTNVAIDEIKDKIGNRAESLFSYPNFFGTIQSFIGRFILKKALYHFYSSKVTVVDTEIHNKKLFFRYNSLGFDDSLRKVIFFKLYASKVLVKEIEEKCFSNKPSIKGEKSHNAKSREILANLKKARILNKDGYLAYGRCQKLKVSDCPNDYGMQRELFEYLSEKHKEGKRNANKIESKREAIKNLRLDINDGALYYFDGHREKKIASKDTDSYKQFKKLKEDLFREGVISFSDAFDISKRYVEENSYFSELLSCRFKYLFIDEMQDTQQEQMRLLNLVFNEKVQKQFFGDPDQSIFDAGGNGKMSWRLDSGDFKKFFISNSMRFSNNISSCIDPFKSEIKTVTGISRAHCGKPIILLYESTDNVLKKFSEIIESKGLLESDCYKNWSRVSEPFNAIGFVGRKANNKTTIGSYYAPYDNFKTSRSKDYSNLISYFQKESKENFENKGTSVYMDKFKRAYIRSINEQGIKESPSKLINALRDDEEAYPIFLSNSLKWIEQIHFNDANPSVVRQEFISFLNDLKILSYSNSFFFTNNDIEVSNSSSGYDSFYSFNGGKIKLGTIHSVKGETHIATLLLECMNNGKSESQHFFNSDVGDLFCGEELKKQLEQGKEQSRRLKSSYVALSRPSHLLCVALKKDNANCVDCTKKEQCNWEVMVV